MVIGQSAQPISFLSKLSLLKGCAKCKLRLKNKTAPYGYLSAVPSFTRMGMESPVLNCVSLHFCDIATDFAFDLLAV